MSSESRAIADAEHADADDSEDSSEDEDFVIGADEAGDDSGNSDSSDDEATASKRKKRARRGDSELAAVDADEAADLAADARASFGANFNLSKRAMGEGVALSKSELETLWSELCAAESKPRPRDALADALRDARNARRVATSASVSAAASSAAAATAAPPSAPAPAAVSSGSRRRTAVVPGIGRVTTASSMALNPIPRTPAASIATASAGWPLAVPTKRHRVSDAAAFLSTLSARGGAGTGVGPRVAPPAGVPRNATSASRTAAAASASSSSEGTATAAAAAADPPHARRTAATAALERMLAPVRRTSTGVAVDEPQYSLNAAVASPICAADSDGSCIGPLRSPYLDAPPVPVAKLPSQLLEAAAAAKASAAVTRLAVSQTVKFAGKTMTVTRLVGAGTEAAKAAVAEAEAARARAAIAGGSASSSSAAGGPASAGTVSLDALVTNLDKPEAITTLTKSSLDWDTYKHASGVGEELERAAKAGFVDKQAFLARVDERRFELEREQRARERSRRELDEAAAARRH